MAEGGGLLNRCTVKSRTGGSNPPLSASFKRPHFFDTEFQSVPLMTDLSRDSHCNFR